MPALPVGPPSVHALSRRCALTACLVINLLLTPWNPAVAIEEPAYTVVRSYAGFEVRRYAPYLVAETLVDASAADAGNQGFRILAAYIFGQNQGARTIEMTAPVAQSPTEIPMTAPVTQSARRAGYCIQFSMPAGWTLASLPAPNDARVKLRAIPARTLAVIRYTGT